MREDSDVSDDQFHADLLRLTPDEGWPLGAIVMSLEEASVYLRVERSTLRQWVKRGRIVRHGRGRYDMGSLMNTLVEELRETRLAA